MDLAEAHIRNAGYGGFSFCDFAAEIGNKSASVHRHFLTKAYMAAGVACRDGDQLFAAVARHPMRAPWVRPSTASAAGSFRPHRFILDNRFFREWSGKAGEAPRQR